MLHNQLDKKMFKKVLTVRIFMVLSASTEGKYDYVFVGQLCVKLIT
jgi:hypothetical protein